MIQLLEVIGFGLVTLLPLANPLTTVALFIGLSADFTKAERLRQSRLTAIYVFVILTVADYVGQAVMSAFGSPIPGLPDRRRTDRDFHRLLDAVPQDFPR